MPDTATPAKPQYVIQLGQDHGFKDLPHEQKLKAIVDLSSKDPHFMQLSGSDRKYVIDKLLGNDTPAPTPAEPQPAPPPEPPPGVLGQALGAAQSVGDVVGRGVVNTLEIPSNLLTQGLRGVNALVQASPGGKALGIPAIPENVLQKGEHPLEDLLTGGQGFPRQTPGMALLQNYVNQTLGAAGMTVPVNAIFPALAKGIPLTEQAITAAMQAVKGVSAEEAAKFVGLPGWAQVAANLVAGGTSTADIKTLFTGLQNKFGLRQHIRGLSDAGGEAFGGPSFVEQRATPAGEVPPTAAAHATTLAQSVEDVKAPVLQAQQARTTAEHAQASTEGRALQASRTTQQAKRAVQDQQDMLTRVSASNEGNVNNALSHAEKAAQTLTPEMAQAGQNAPQVGRGMVANAGERARDLYDNAYTFFKNNAEKVYGKLWQDHNIDAPVSPLLKRIADYEDTMKSRLRERYEPSGYLNEVQKFLLKTGTVTDEAEWKAVQDAIAKGDLSGILGTLTGSSQLGSVNIGLKDVHTIRSSILEDLRYMAPGNMRQKPTKQLLSEINAYVEELGKDAPDAIEAMGFANRWYRTEVQRFTSGPGEVALKRNPMTGAPELSPTILGNRIFADGPGVSRISQKSVEHLDAFTTYMNDIDHTLARAKATNDIPLIAQAHAAREGVLDVARAKFYDAAMSSGSYNTKAAEKWLTAHDALIKARPEMQQLFGDVTKAHQAIQDVQANAQGILADEQGFLNQFKRQADLASRVETDAKLHAQDTASQVQVARTQEAAALEDYKATFGGVKAASHALQETHAEMVLGQTPSAIVQEIEGLSGDNPTRAYAKWMNKAGNDPQVRQALLYEKWKNFVGPDGIAVPAKAAAFIKENTPFLQRYYPDYLKNIMTIQAGFEQAAKLQAESGKGRLLTRLGAEGGGVMLANMLGLGNLAAPAILLEGGLAFKHFKAVAALQDIYTNPASAKVLADALRSKIKTRIAAATWSVLVRSGAATAPDAVQVFSDYSTP